MTAEELLELSLRFSHKIGQIREKTELANTLKEELQKNNSFDFFVVYWKNAENLFFQEIFRSENAPGISTQQIHDIEKLSILEKSGFINSDLHWKIWNTASQKNLLIISKSKTSSQKTFSVSMECLVQKWISVWENILWQEETENTSRQLGMIRALSEEVGKTFTLKPLLSKILKLTIQLVNADRGFIMLQDTQDDLLKTEIVHGLPNPKAEELINEGKIPTEGIPLGKGVQGKVLQSAKSIKIDRVQDYSDLGLEEGIETIICVPLIMNSKAFGVIYVTNKKDGSSFSERDLDLVSIFAGNVSTVIHQAQLQRIMVTDPLTSLFTRRYFMPQLESELRRCERYNRDLSIIGIDADHFKNVNDTWGHQAGDLVLKTISETIQEGLRSNIDIPCRYGGEEFFILLPETPEAGAIIVAERIRKSMEEKVIEWEGVPIKITLSLGISVFPKHGKMRDEILDNADKALYKSKTTGRNRVTVFSDDLENKE